MNTVTIAVMSATVVAVGCTSSSPSPEPAVVPEVADQGRFATSEFCRTMLDLERSEPSIDRIISVYGELLPTAPPEIAADLAAVLADLTGDGPPLPSPADPVDPVDPVDPADPDMLGDLDELDERVPPAMPDPAQAIAAYLDEFCRSTVVNPLPGPTDPP